MTRIKSILLTLPLVAFVSLAAAMPASAATILVFGQNGVANTVTITGAAGVTTISGTNIPITITGMENTVGSTAGFLTLSATSFGAAALVSGDDQQHFTGTWSICNTPVCAINYLSGTFADLGTGQAGGAAFALDAATPGDTVTFTTNGPITSTALDRAISFAFTNWTPGVSIVGGTIGSATASIAGNFSGNITQQQTIPEPASMLLLGSGLLGLAVARRRFGRKNA